jgi:RHS repeat-associated protein
MMPFIGVLISWLILARYLHSDQTTGTRSFRQKIDNTYNIRGWLTKINSPDLSGDNDLFGMQLCYNDASGMGGITPVVQYNGNMAGMKWGIKNDLIRGYKFTYDSLNRLKVGYYADGSGLNTNMNQYTEMIGKYDRVGNIIDFRRWTSVGQVDMMTYAFNSTYKNRINTITDTGASDANVDDYPGGSSAYSYDTNGNMVSDGAKDCSVEYIKALNLPQDLDFGSNNRIFYHYTAGGEKVAKHSVPGSGTGTLTKYVGNIVYINEVLKYILTEDGRLVADGTGVDRKFLYEYSLKDHLGNSRVAFTGANLGNSVDIVQTTNYYPFGLVFKQANNDSIGYRRNKYLYNGKELQDDKMVSEALDWYDYGARFYDPQIGRFTTLDPATELGRRWSPYTYTFDNPIRFIDPEGMWPGFPNPFASAMNELKFLQMKLMGKLRIL